MAKKKAPIPSKPRRNNAEADKWVSGETASPPTKTGTIKRLTLDLDEDLHRRIKVACSTRGSTMVQEITKLLEKAFPES